MTSGGSEVTSGLDDRRFGARSLTAATFLAVGLVYLVVNATSLLDERETLGLPVEPWRAWTWEGTSLAAWLMLLPLILWVAERAFPPAMKWLAAFACHVFALLGFSAAHTGLMSTFRTGIYRIADAMYQPTRDAASLLVYELRKDVITYVAIVAVYQLFRRLVRPAVIAPSVDDPLIEVRDGAKCYWLRPEEIDVISAQGNYVQLRGKHGEKLVRRTLSDVERELTGRGFVRIHRSHLVRKKAVLKAEVRQSGDFEVTLSGGERLTGSRRYRRSFEAA